MSIPNQILSFLIGHQKVPRPIPALMVQGINPRLPFQRDRRLLQA